MKYRVKVVSVAGKTIYYPQHKRYFVWKDFYTDRGCGGGGGGWRIFFPAELLAKVFIDNEKNKKDNTYINC